MLATCETSFQRKMIIEQKIQQAVLKAVKELYGQEVPEKMAQLQKT